MLNEFLVPSDFIWLVAWAISWSVYIYVYLQQVNRSKFSNFQSKKKGKDQVSIQLSTTPDPGYQWESDNFTIRHHKREPKWSALSQQVTTRHQ